VALVQTAATLPMFFLGLPSGALADILDRRRFLMMTQVWATVVALLLCLGSLWGQMTPPILLALLFLNGIGLALRWPVYSAVIPELVSRPQLPSAMALNGIGMNASRIAGPLVAGALIASAGTAWVFVLNAVLSAITIVIIYKWKRVHVVNPLGRERLLSAMRVGVQFVGQSARLKGVLVRIALHFFHSTALLALLPLIARGLDDGDAGTFTLLLAGMGVGAIAAALFLPRMRRALPRDTLVSRSTALQSLAILVVAFAPNIYLALPGMLMAGAAWIIVANTLSVSAQLALPNWVRARGMSMFQMAIMGGTAVGAAIFGNVASFTSVQAGLVVAAVSGVLTMALAQRMMVDRSIEEDLSPTNEARAPLADVPPQAGRVRVTIEYLIDPARAEEFRALMQESRRSRLSHGALNWELLHDIADPRRFLEQIEDESWTDHLRRFERVTAGDVALRERKLAFHIGEQAPVITRVVVEPGMRG